MFGKTSLCTLMLPLALLAGATTNAQTLRDEDWKFIGRDITYIHHYSSKRLVRLPEGTVKTWLTTRLAPPIEESRASALEEMRRHGMKIEGYERLSHHLIQSEFDCTRRRRRDLSSVIYASDGTSISSVSDDHPSWYEPIPDSIGEMVLDAVCQAAKAQSTLK